MRHVSSGLVLVLALMDCSAIVSSAQGLKGTPPVVLLDCFHNNEWKADARGARHRFHYVWDDTANSGFSLLGEIIRGEGGDLATLTGPPGVSVLRDAAIYILVDPDTPQETAFPNYISDSSANCLVEWTTAGGILLLLGNDKGNAEFEHFNTLAARFGIHFNEDSRNRVTGQDYAMGSFSLFPAHPLFHGVRKIFLKDISTITVVPPAKSLLEDHGDVIIATALFGNGMVLAVGDPWFYNEYMDHRRLPQDFDNDTAARNLFGWLLQRSLNSRMNNNSTP